MDILYKKKFQNSPASTKKKIFKNIDELWNFHGFLNIDWIGLIFLIFLNFIFLCASVRTNLQNYSLDWNFSNFFHTNT